VWRLNLLSSLHYRNWDDNWVVFDTGSGQTHQMSTLCAAALMHCENDWILLSDIAAGVAADLNLPGEQNLSEILQPLLRNFLSLDLLEYKPE
jgi:hypothetical protein